MPSADAYNEEDFFNDFLNKVDKDNKSGSSNKMAVKSDPNIIMNLEKDVREETIDGNYILEKYGVDISSKTRPFVYRVDKVIFDIDPVKNAEYLWGHKKWLMGSGRGLYNVIKNNSNLSNFMFIFNKDDHTAIIRSSKGRRIDQGEEEIRKLQEFYEKEFKQDGENLHIVFTEQKTLWKTDSILDRGSFFIVGLSNFYIPDKRDVPVAYITVRGKIARSIKGLQNIYGKSEKYIYDSKGDTIMEERYPIYDPNVDFTIDCSLFDNITILDLPPNLNIALISKEDSDKIDWDIQSISYPINLNGTEVFTLDDNDQWLLQLRSDSEGRKEFIIYSSGLIDDEHQVIKATLEQVKRSSENVKKPRTKPLTTDIGESTSKPETIDVGERIAQDIFKKAQIKPETIDVGERKPKDIIRNRPEKNLTIDVEERVFKGDDKGKLKMRTIDIGEHKAKEVEIQEFVLTHRLLPMLDKKIKLDIPKEGFVIPVKVPSELVIDENMEQWLEIVLGFKDLQGKDLDEDCILIIPKCEELYLIGEKTPLKPTQIEYTPDVDSKVITIVNKPGISNPLDADFRCTLDFSSVPKYKSGGRKHWCLLDIEPEHHYKATANMIIGRGCYYQPEKADFIDIIPEGFLDNISEKYYNALNKDEKENAKKFLDNFGYMKILSSRYHGFFIKEHEMLYNISLSQPIFVYGNDGKQKNIIKPIDKNVLPKKLQTMYEEINELEDKGSRKQLMEKTVPFLISSEGLLTSKDLLKHRDKTPLNSGDSVIIGLSKYLYQKKRL
ncbi:MAG: hypothetical protein HQK78_15820 [Desulfobacterales bacterium]|nr:hypothetical protein [Desulfobacterales bacterium]